MSTDGEQKQPMGNLNAGSGDETLVVCDQEKQAPPPTAPPAPQLVTGVKLWLMIVGIYLACFLMLLDTTVVSTAIPQITNEFNSLPDIGWYGSAYNLGCAAVAPLTGKIYRHFSLKWSFITLFALFEVGSAICGAAQSSKMLIVGRAIAGIGAASLLNGSITIVSCAAPPEKRPIAQLGNVAGPLVGGAFTSGYTWRWSFYINLPLGVIVGLPLVLLDIPDQVPKQSVWKVLPRIHHHLDLLGFALFAPAVIQLLLALQYGGNEYP
ncbi:efflux pump [Metarhizium guizhouense ARSEF 977]|uniref:Efflux pump n=1 Tax=Metarhizium guizhouense (strain ARSEF 977) TaxID=1276136 RepID=A0A0B4GWU1_METGA|nr:efflux pump [Metarhizium guizhouense ARSEF 977]